jgi:tRNA threonylcarbamoyladenosine biosynthesis protein TsaB
VIVLGIETATAVCGAAVVRDGIIRGEALVVEKYAHAERIVQLIDDSLRMSSVAIRQLDAFAVSIGPGSFTGLRIGLSVAKGLSYALEKPIVAVPTLRALAQRAVDANLVSTRFILPAIDARRDEVYCQLFRREGDGIVPEAEELDYRLSGLVEQLVGNEITVTGDAVQKVKAAAQSIKWKFVEGEFAQCSAATVALLGEWMLMRGDVADAATLEPTYVKEFFTITK